MKTELKDTQVQLLLTKSLLEKIDDYRFKNRLRSRNEAMRQLIEKGLSAKDD